MGKSKELAELGDVVTQSGGSVGVNTADPTSLGGGSKLTVNQADDGNIIFARGGSTRQVQLGTTSTTGYINADNTTNGLALHMNGTERMRIDASGRVTMPYQPHIFYSTLNTTTQTGSGVTPIYTYQEQVRGTNGYNTSTGVYTAPISGVYSCKWAYLYQNVTGTATIDDGFVFNGTYIYSGNRFDVADYSFDDGYAAVQGSVNIYLNANDTFHPQTQIGGDGSWNFYGGGNWGFLTITMIG